MLALRKIFISWGVAFLITQAVLGQDLQSRLAQNADFVPTANSQKGLLVEIAKHYKLPMGIEWAYDLKEKPIISLTPQPTVEALLELVLAQAPSYFMEIKDGVINIRHTSYSEDSRNFLTLRLPEYKAKKVNVFAAEWQLRLEIHRTIHPEQYSNGFNGGYGQPDRGDGFNISNISYSGKNVKVRDVLNAIVKQNGNALWLVELNPSKVMRDERFFVQHVYGTDVDADFAWEIIAFGASEPGQR